MPDREMNDIEIFADRCAFARSAYLHGKLVFEASSAEDKELLHRAAPIFFSDLNQMLIEYVILQVCKLTDPAQDFRKNDNHTVAFLVKHYDFSDNPVQMKRLDELRVELGAFGDKLRPARNKIISHSDRISILGGLPLGSATDAEWSAFWQALEELVNIVHVKVNGTPFLLGSVGMPSDADGLLRALRHADLFERMISDRDPAVRARSQQLALG